MRIFRVFRVCLGLALTAILSVPAWAQSPLTPASVVVQRYDEIPNFDGDTGIFCCATFVNESGEADFYHVRAVFDVAFSETLDRVSVNANDILLMLPGAEEGLRAIGHFDYIPIFEYGAQSIFARRPRDWPDGTRQAFLDGVWIVPPGVGSATLLIGEEGAQIQVPLDLNVPVSQVIRPSSTVQVAVTGFDAEGQLAVSDRSNGQDVTGRVVPMAGQSLRLDLTLTPLTSTSTTAQAGENRFFLYSTYIGLVGPDGLPLPPLGYRANDQLRQRWSVSISWQDQPRPMEMSLYFLGNADPGTYTVYYLSDPVAQFNLQ